MYSSSILDIDPAAETGRIVEAMQAFVSRTLRRRGAVVGISGGIDSSVVAALCARAFGPERVLGLIMPERHSSADSRRLGEMLAATVGIAAVTEDITPLLESAGCYRLQEEAIRSSVPEYGAGWKCKLVLPSLLEGERLNVTLLTVQDPAGATATMRLTAGAYHQLVAATNYKQRVRKMTEYYHADRLQYAVAGTHNRLEHDQGFFVKQGDGCADFKPIAHLYKTQVYQLARYLGVPAEICSRPPTTDTFPLEQTQEEFYFALPYDSMDLCLHAYNHNVPAAAVAPAVGLTAEQVERVYRDIEGKRRATRYLHTPALILERAAEASAPCAELPA
jgi:NAD+ synthase